ncbi:MAG: hypothetical protein POG24_07410 [Acidocella sp.]|nr:hypothetical protein [Acidocella sp.]
MAGVARVGAGDPVGLRQPDHVCLGKLDQWREDRDRLPDACRDGGFGSKPIHDDHVPHRPGPREGKRDAALSL